ncbi:MAG: PaaI family thioesterase [Gemmatimonadetes bacterium]|nr:PaaI family thioesterase [Gemmatimonadota bacterium]
MGFRIEIGDGEARVEATMRPEFHHAAGAVHGSILFRALDDAAFFAASSVVRSAFVLTASFEVHYLRPVVEGGLVAEGRVLHRSRRRVLAEAVASDARGRVVARGTGTFMPSEMALDDLEGYRAP